MDENQSGNENYLTPVSRRHKSPNGSLLSTASGSDVDRSSSRKSFPSKIEKKKKKERYSEASQLEFIESEEKRSPLENVVSRPMPSFGMSLNLQAINYFDQPSEENGADTQKAKATSKSPLIESRDRKPKSGRRTSGASRKQKLRISVKPNNDIDSRRKSWQIVGNTLSMQGVQLGDKGMVNAFINNMPREFRRMAANVQYIDIGSLGTGASSIVFKAIHVPTLQLVAIKQIPIHDRAKRHQIAAELKTFGKNVQPLWSSPISTIRSSKLNWIKKSFSSSPVRTRSRCLSPATISMQKNFKHVIRRLNRAISSGSGLSNSIHNMESPARLQERRGKHKVFPELSKSVEHLDDVPEMIQHCPYLVSLKDAFTGSSAGNDPLTAKATSYPSEVSMVMELMNGSLLDFMKKGIKFSEEMIAHVARRSLLGLMYLHVKGFLHRDIKPANILVSKAGEIKLSDFGISRRLESWEEMENENNDAVNNSKENKACQVKYRQRKASTKTFVGTATYMSPERINGESYSFSSDIWSLGLTCLGLSLGQFPIREGENNGYWGIVAIATGQMAPECPPQSFSDEFCHFVCECLRLDPDLRPSAGQLLTHPFLTKGIRRRRNRRALGISAYQAIKLYEAGDFSIRNLEEVFLTQHCGERQFHIRQNYCFRREKFNNYDFDTEWKRLWDRICVSPDVTEIYPGKPLKPVCPHETSGREDYHCTALYSVENSKEHGDSHQFQVKRHPSETGSKLLSLMEARGLNLMKGAVESLYTLEKAEDELIMISYKIKQWYEANRMKKTHFSEKEVQVLAEQLGLTPKHVKKTLNNHFDEKKAKLVLS